MEENILEMQNISKSFFGVWVLFDVNFSVRRGEVHALLGENGAGKSTLTKILSAVYRKESGEIILDGKPLHADSPRAAMDAGVSVIFQEFNLNPHATIYDNIFLGREYMKNGLVGRTREIAEARRLLERMEMPLDPCMEVRHLSTAQKQVVEICKALSTEAKVIVFDEPTASITDKETALLFKIIRQLRSEGVGIVYISHRLEEIFEICGRCTIMRDGCSVATFDVAGVTKDRLAVQFTRNINPRVKTDETVLSVRNLTYKDRVKNVSFELKRGQVLGFSGLVGAGRTELMKCIAGAYDYKEGMAARPPHSRLAQ